jgi:hypothetical protein
MAFCKRLKRHFVLLVLAGSVGSLALAAQQSSVARRDTLTSRDARDGFGKSESISGSIAAVDKRGVLVVKREGPSEPSSTQLIVTQTRQNANEPPQTDSVQAVPAPGQTEYTFRVTTSTRIQVNGHSATLAELASLHNQEVTVDFIPRRSGNFASSIEVGHGGQNQVK